MKNKKLFAILTLVCFMFTLMPVAAMAESDEPVVVTTEEALQAAVTTASAIQLGANITLTKTVKILDGKTVTIDLNGKTIDFNQNEWVYGAANSGTALLTVCFGGDLTIMDSSEAQNGTIDGSANVNDVYGAVMMTAKGDDASNGTAKLTVNSGILKGGYAAIAGNKDRDNTEITINGGKVTVGISDTYSTAAIEHPMNGKLTINGGTIEGMDGISMRSGTLLITGGTIIGTAPESAFEDDGYWDNDFGTCTGHALQIVSRANSNSANETPSVSITGGTFTAANTTAVGSYAGYKGATPDTQIVGFISGGTFSSVSSDYLADGYGIDLNGQVTADTTIDTEKELKKAVAAGGEVVLGGDITLTSTVKITNGTAVTIDLNGKTINFDQNKWVYGAANSGTALLTVEFGGDLTIMDSSEAQNGTIDGSANVNDVYGAVMMTAKGDDASNGTAKLTVNSGVLKGGYAAIAGNKDRDNTEITINGGKITAGTSTTYSTAGIEHPMNGKLTINGGTIEGMDGISMRSGTLLITDGTIIGTAPESAFEDDGYWDNDFGTCTGHALQIVSRANSNSANETPSVSITGGTFTAANTTAVGSYAADGDTQIVGFIAGGVFSSNPTAYLAAGKCVNIENATEYVVAEHKVEAVEVKAPTCTEDGVKAHYACENCGTLYSDAAGETVITVPEVDPAKNHAPATDWTTDATQHWKVCTNGCNEILGEKADHTFGDWNTTKEATTSEKGAKERECSVCKFKETAEIAKLTPVYSGGYVPSTPSTPKVETETTVTPSGTKVETTTETKADGTTVETTTTTTATGETTKVEVTTETNKEGTTVETTVTTDAQGETSTTVTATLDNGSAVTNNDAAVEVEVTKVEEKVVTQVEEAVKADDNIEVVGTADNAVSVSATDSNTGAAQTNFVQPMAVSVPVDTTVLNNVEDTSKLTLAKVVTNEDGTTELVYMGGSYDKETGKFNAKVNEDGDYILVEKADLVKIELTIDDTTVKHNDAHQELDVAPVINAETGRTELPLSYLGDALGFEVLWDSETRTVTVVKGDISFSLTIGEEIPGYGTPYIDVNSDRTMVSASYISGMLGANVIWDPVDRQVIVVK